MSHMLSSHALDPFRDTRCAIAACAMPGSDMVSGPKGNLDANVPRACVRAFLFIGANLEPANCSGNVGQFTNHKWQVMGNLDIPYGGMV